ncbi:DUF443 family protein [Lentibacillus sp. CBA3610]|uniref:DUF443 family protein n=1 Tax=Lentibacillus sp. CBA3610 TaxID=2518176 RepID=UPI0020D22259|nr:DUF443 family protein [Lentibacillus sp. CBA3610]
MEQNHKFGSETMNCKAQGVYKNPRYKILTVNDEKYVLDMGGRSFWKILFPFVYWILPNTAYKVNDLEIIETIKTPEVEQTDTGWLSVLGGIVAIILANLLRPLANVFNIPSSPFVNSIIVMIVLLLVLSLFFYINQMSKRRLYQVADIEQYSEKRLWIRPKSYKQFFFIFFVYLFFLGFTVLAYSGFIYTGDVMVLFMGTPVLLILLCINLVTIVGDTRVRFKDDKKAVI